MLHRIPQVLQQAALSSVVAIYLLLAAGGALAQVNTEIMRVGDPQPGFSGLLGASLDLKAGNVDYFEVQGNGQLNYNWDIHGLLLSSTAGYGKTQGDAFAKNAFGHLRWTAMWHERVGSEVFTQIEYDQFLRKQLRALFGLGPRFLIIRTQTFETFGGVGYMLEREVLDIPASDPHPARSINHRMTSYLSLKWNPSDPVSLVQTLYVQPRIDRPKDLRMLEQADLRVAITKLLTIKTSVTVLYDGRPPQDVKKTNLTLTQGVDLVF